MNSLLFGCLKHKSSFVNAQIVNTRSYICRKRRLHCLTQHVHRPCSCLRLSANRSLHTYLEITGLQKSMLGSDLFHIALSCYRFITNKQFHVCHHRSRCFHCQCFSAIQGRNSGRLIETNRQSCFMYIHKNILATGIFSLLFAV